MSGIGVFQMLLAKRRAPFDIIINDFSTSPDKSTTLRLIHRQPFNIIEIPPRIRAFAVSSISIRPLPVAYLRHVVPVSGHILPVLDTLVDHLLLDMSPDPLQFWHPIDNIHDQVKTIQIV
jgi:hypothetical protein